MKKEKRILSIGAHPDDADTYCGGLLSKLRDKGWQVRLLSVTDGSAGTYQGKNSNFSAAARLPRAEGCLAAVTMCWITRTGSFRLPLKRVSTLSAIFARLRRTLY